MYLILVHCVPTSLGIDVSMDRISSVGREKCFADKSRRNISSYFSRAFLAQAEWDNFPKVFGDTLELSSMGCMIGSQKMAC